MSGYTGRLAPSPTGALHLGNVRTFMIAWLRARSCGGRILLRMEDLDHPRDKPGADREAVEDLRWLGFDWDGYCVQSGRKDLYRAALDELLGKGAVYPCVCSRRDVEAAQSAPHAGEQLFYPGTCRGKFSSWREACEYLKGHGSGMRIPCWRFKVSPGMSVSFTDGFAGVYSMDVARVLGDFPLARDEGGAGYTLASVLDDSLTGVTEVVRGDDLLPATPAQILVCRALGHKEPDYFHVPLVVGKDGNRLAKRHGDTRIAKYRAEGWSAEKIIGLLAASCGLGDGSPVKLSELTCAFTPSVIPRRPFVLNESEMFPT